MTRSLRLLAVLCLATLVGCATPDDVGRPAEDVITVMLADDWATSSAMLDAIDAFEAEHDVRVAVRAVEFGQLGEYMQADRTGAREIDVAQWHAFAAGHVGYAIPVTARFAAEYPDGTFIPGAIDDVTWGGQIYGVPLDTNAMVAIVNVDLLQQVGGSLEDLETWDGVRQVAAEAAGQRVRYTHVPASTWSTYAWLRANGGDWFTVDESGEITLQLGGPRTRETFRFLASLTVNETRGFTSDTVDTSAEAFPLFADSQIIALHTGTWDVARLLDEDPGFRWTVVPMPRGPGSTGPSTVLGGSSLYMAEQVADAELAWAFITHVVQPRYALEYARRDGRLPPRTDVLSDPMFTEDRYRVAVEQLPNGSAMRLLAFPRVNELTTQAIFQVLGDGPPAVNPTFRALQRQAQRALTRDLEEASESPTPQADPTGGGSP